MCLSDVGIASISQDYKRVHSHEGSSSGRVVPINKIIAFGIFKNYIIKK